MSQQESRFKILIRNPLIRCEYMICAKSNATTNSQIKEQRNVFVGEGGFQPGIGQHRRMQWKDRLEEMLAQSRATLRLYHKESLLGFAITIE